MAELAELAVKLTDEVNDVYERQEMINGKIYMQAACPATNHNRIVRNLSAKFYTYLRGKKCESFGENMKVVLNNKNYFIIMWQKTPTSIGGDECHVYRIYVSN